MRLLLSVLFFVILFGCNKSGDNEKPAEPPPSNQPALSLNATEASPGDAVVVKVNKTGLAGETNISFNGNTIKGYATGDTAYIFLVPVVSPGTAAISIPSITGSNTLSLTIKNYTAIADPQAVINEFVDKRNKSIDSLSKINPITGFQTSAATLTLLSQLKEEMDIQLKSLSAADKELLSYMLQKNMPNINAYNWDLLSPAYYARTTGLQGDVGDQLVATAKNYVTAQTVCLAMIPVMVGSGASLLIAPNPFSAAVFISAFTTFVLSREIAIRRAQEVGRLKGVAEEIVGADAQRMMGGVSFIFNEEKTLSLSVSFRNLAASDAGLQTDISSAFTSEQSFAGKDKEIESLYGKIKASSWFTKLSSAYIAYTSVIGKIPKATTAVAIEGKNLLVKGVSDSRITYTTYLSGTARKIRISSTANDTVNFNLKLAYARTIDGKEMTTDISCSFYPVRTGITIAGGKGYGTADDQFMSVNGLFVDASGNIYVADQNNSRVVKWAPGAKKGEVVAGITGYTASNLFAYPRDIVVNASGTMYISDWEGRVVSWVPGATTSSYVLGQTVGGSAANQLYRNKGLCFDAAGNLYIADTQNDRVQKLPKGASSAVTVAGGAGRGGGANQLNSPNDIWVDAAGNLYVADAGNHRIQKWAPGASVGVAVAGGNSQGAAVNQLNYPASIVLDRSGNMYILDAGNQRVQKWTPGATSGITVAGGNGQGSAANQLSYPADIYLDSSGNIYIADGGNYRVQMWPAY